MDASAAKRNRSAFAGWPPAKIKVAWRVKPDNMGKLNVIRLIVSDDLWEKNQSNGYYSHGLLPAVAGLLGGFSGLVVSPAGTQTLPLSRTPAPTVDGVFDAADELMATIRHHALGALPFELLLGLDGCIQNVSTPVQLSLRVGGNGTGEPIEPTVKLYPQSREAGYLVGWKVCREAGAVPKRLQSNRRAETAAGKGVVLVCNDAIPFSGRSMGNLGSDKTKLAIRDHFMASCHDAKFAFMQAHAIGSSSNSGGVFVSAMNELCENNVTSVFSTFAPDPLLEKIADRFAPRGPNAEAVGTLLVRTVT